MIVRNLAAVVCCAAVVASVGPLRAAADRRSDEAAIRALIAQRDEGKRVASTSDRVFWSGAYQKPYVGTETGTRRKEDERVQESIKTKTNVRRIVIAEAGDMAYEYSDGSIDYDLKTGTHVSEQTSTLRVWQKQGGEWKTAATFTIPHYTD